MRITKIPVLFCGSHVVANTLARYSQFAWTVLKISETNDIEFRNLYSIQNSLLDLSFLTKPKEWLDSLPIYKTDPWWDHQLEKIQEQDSQIGFGKTLQLPLIWIELWQQTPKNIRFPYAYADYGDIFDGSYKLNLPYCVMCASVCSMKSDQPVIYAQLLVIIKGSIHEDLREALDAPGRTFKQTKERYLVEHKPDLIYHAALLMLPITWISNIYYLDIDAEEKKALLLVLIRHVARHAFLILKKWEHVIIVEHYKERGQDVMNRSLAILRDRSALQRHLEGWDKNGIDGLKLRSSKPSFLTRIYGLLRYDDEKEPLLKEH